MKAIYLSGVAIVAGLVLSGCVTLTPENQRNLCTTIERALTVPEDQLEASRQPRDRFAASIALRYGLNGAPHNEVLADAILARLTAPHTQMMSYYVSGTKKIPGHMVFMPMTTYEINPYEVQVVENCLTLLSDQGQPPQAALEGGVCGGAENYRRLKDLWTKATT
ncbi:MAG: hypothetical protein JF571_04285 [Asticcacaulis sp.]|nr:hypothetical protein [Asticcacaulis sp.]